VSSSPVEIGDAMVGRVEQLLAPVRQTSRDDVEEFLGRLLTGPKPHVVFPEAPKMSRGELLQRLGRPESIGLALPSRGLVRGQRVFLNGHAAVVDDAGLQFWSRLVRERRVLGPVGIGGAGLELLLEAFARGCVRFEGAPSSSSSSSKGRLRR